MTLQTPNCLVEGQTLETVAAIENFSSVQITFCREEITAEGPKIIEDCYPHEATLLTVYGLNDYRESVAIHDAQLTDTGIEEAIAVAIALLRTILVQTGRLNGKFGRA